MSRRDIKIKPGRYKEFLELVAVEMKARGIDQAALAETIGASPSTVSRWFSNERKPTIASVILMADAVGIDRAVSLRKIGWLPPKRHDPTIESLTTRAESAIVGMSPEEALEAVELLEHLARVAQKRRTAHIGKAERLPISAA